MYNINMSANLELNFCIAFNEMTLRSVNARNLDDTLSLFAYYLANKENIFKASKHTKAVELRMMKSLNTKKIQEKTFVSLATYFTTVIQRGCAKYSKSS
jgi:hypothetical protein